MSEQKYVKLFEEFVNEEEEFDIKDINFNLDSNLFMTMGRGAKAVNYYHDYGFAAIYIPTTKKIKIVDYKNNFWERKVDSIRNAKEWVANFIGIAEEGGDIVDSLNDSRFKFITNVDDFWKVTLKRLKKNNIDA